MVVAKGGPERTVCPFAVPAAIGLDLADEPVDDRRNVDAEIGAVGNGAAVDALLDFALPIGLAAFVPAGMRADQVDGSLGPLGRRVETEFPELRQRKAGCRPGLALRGPLVLVETGGDEGAARPLAVIVLMREKPGAPTFGLHLGPFGFPQRLWSVQQVAHHLPPDCGIRCEKPVNHWVGHGRAPGLCHRVDLTRSDCTS